MNPTRNYFHSLDCITQKNAILNDDLSASKLNTNLIDARLEIAKSIWAEVLTGVIVTLPLVCVKEHTAAHDLQVTHNVSESFTENLFDVQWAVAAEISILLVLVDVLQKVTEQVRKT